MKSWAEKASARINAAVEAMVAFLMLALVLDVWLGVADRYFLGWQLPWPEEMARYKRLDGIREKLIACA